MTPSEPPYAALIAALAAGRSDAYAALYDRLGPSLLRTAGSMLGSAAEAEDAVQEVFVALVRSRHRLEAVEDLRAYVFAILRNHIARRIKRSRAEHAALREMAISRTDTSVDPSALDDGMEAMLKGLPAEQREVVILKIDAELSFAQIAAVLGISPNTAASRYRYAMEKLSRQPGDAE